MAVRVISDGMFLKMPANVKHSKDNHYVEARGNDIDEIGNKICRLSVKNKRHSCLKFTNRNRKVFGRLKPNTGQCRLSMKIGKRNGKNVESLRCVQDAVYRDELAATRRRNRAKKRGSNATKRKRKPQSRRKTKGGR